MLKIRVLEGKGLRAYGVDSCYVPGLCPTSAHTAPPPPQGSMTGFWWGCPPSWTEGGPTPPPCPYVQPCPAPSGRERWVPSGLGGGQEPGEDCWVHNFCGHLCGALISAV